MAAGLRRLLYLENVTCIQVRIAPRAMLSRFHEHGTAFCYDVRLDGVGAHRAVNVGLVFVLFDLLWAFANGVHDLASSHLQTHERGHWVEENRKDL